MKSQLKSSSRTWAGERGEEWSPAQGLESVLISIQSLLSRNPYYNEPGFEESNTGRHDLETVQLYSDKVGQAGL